MQNTSYARLYEFVIKAKQLRLSESDDYIPQIVVIGCQSAGKSTLLNRIIQYELLPTKETLCSKFPVDISLSRDVSRKGSGHAGGSDRTRSFDELKKGLCAKNEATPEIIDTPYKMVLYGDYPRISLVDLPGLAINSAQYAVTEELASKYAKMDLTILLTVTSITEDLDTSLAIKKAREYDPRGVRTIHVLTKCDMLNPDKDTISKILNNRILKPNLNTVITMNSFKNSSFAEINDKEAETLTNYVSDTKCHGLMYLNDILSHEFEKKLREEYRRIVSYLEEKRREAMREYEELEKIKPEVEMNYATTKFQHRFTKIIQGKEHYSPTSIEGGAKIQQQLYTNFIIRIKSMEISKNNEESIHIHLTNVRGRNKMNDSIEQCCIRILEEEIDKLAHPCFDVINKIYEILQDLVDETLQKIKVNEKIEEVMKKRVNEYILERKEDVIKGVKELIESEKLCIDIKENLTIDKAEEEKPLGTISAKIMNSDIADSAFQKATECIVNIGTSLLPPAHRIVASYLLSNYGPEDMSKVVKGLFDNPKDEENQEDVMEDLKKKIGPNDLEDIKRVSNANEFKVFCKTYRKEIQRTKTVIDNTKRSVEVYFDGVKENFLRNIPMKVQYLFLQRILEDIEKLGEMVADAESILSDDPYKEKMKELKDRIDKIEKLLYNDI